VNRFVLEATPGAVRVRREHESGQVDSGPVGHRGGGITAGKPGGGRSGRPVLRWTPASRRAMRWRMLSLPWLGLARVRMVTLTMPDDWRPACASGAVSKAQLAAFRKRWERAWGPMRAVWALEYQERGAPHYHLYVAVPLEAEIERDTFGHDRWDWASRAWYEVVGSGDEHHLGWGVHFARAVPFTKRVSASKVADYFWRESGKWGQKRPPEDFDHVGNFWGVWGMRPVTREAELSRREFVVLRRELLALRRSHSGGWKPTGPRGLDGCWTRADDGLAVAVRLLGHVQQRLMG
jgi:hypothetical protein